MTDPQRGADGGEGLRGEMVTFFDAVADDPGMTPEQKIHWLRVTAADYLEKLEAAERVVEAACAVDAALDNDEFDTSNIVVETVLLRLSNALAAYVATTHPAEASSPASEEDATTAQDGTA